MRPSLANACPICSRRLTSIRRGCRRLRYWSCAQWATRCREGWRHSYRPLRRRAPHGKAPRCLASTGFLRRLRVRPGPWFRHPPTPCCLRTTANCWPVSRLIVRPARASAGGGSPSSAIGSSVNSVLRLTYGRGCGPTSRCMCPERSIICMSASRRCMCSSASRRRTPGNCCSRWRAPSACLPIC